MRKQRQLELGLAALAVTCVLLIVIVLGIAGYCAELPAACGG